MLIKNYIKLTSEEMYAIWWHMGFTDQHTDTMSLATAIQKYPIVWALHTADMMASNFMEDKDGNKKGFEWQELGAENSSNSAGQYADNPALPSDSDEPVFMEPHHVDRRNRVQGKGQRKGKGCAHAGCKAGGRL